MRIVGRLITSINLFPCTMINKQRGNNEKKITSGTKDNQDFSKHRLKIWLLIC